MQLIFIMVANLPHISHDESSISHRTEQNQTWYSSQPPILVSEITMVARVLVVLVNKLTNFGIWLKTLSLISLKYGLKA